MAQLVTADPRSLVAPLSQLGAGFAQGQQIGANFNNRRALAAAQQQKQSQLGFQQQALAGNKEALGQINDPQSARQIQSFLAAQSEEERAEGLRENEVLTRGALDALALPVEERRAFVTRQVAKLKGEGRDTSRTESLLALPDDQFNQGLEVQGRQGLAIQDIAKQQFPAPLTAAQSQTLDIKNATLDIRKEENETRKLEQQLKREDNELKREDLKLKIGERKDKIEKNKRDVVEGMQASVDQIQSTLDTIDRVRNHPGLESATGVFSVAPTFAGSDAANFEAQIETLQSQQFLSAVSQMKGMGALSENEGKKLASSIGALNLNMSDKAMKDELDRIFEVTTKAKARMAARIPKAEPEAEQTQQVNEGQTATNPQTGETVIMRGGQWQAL
jgi:hypothetical protein